MIFFSLKGITCNVKMLTNLFLLLLDAQEKHFPYADTTIFQNQTRRSKDQVHFNFYRQAFLWNRRLRNQLSAQSCIANTSGRISGERMFNLFRRFVRCSYSPLTHFIVEAFTIGWHVLVQLSNVLYFLNTHRNCSMIRSI